MERAVTTCWLAPWKTTRVQAQAADDADAAVKPANATQAKRESALFSLMLALLGIRSSACRASKSRRAVMKKHPKNRTIRLLGC